MPKQEYALVEHSSVINTIIRDTFKTTQRIKFTAFDVSPKYIIFGATSGGIYIFTREPCQFLKLIPSTHGPANYLQISPNEENLAIAVETGLVIILEGCFTPQFEQQIFSEHEGNTVTAMKWNGNDLYCGDSVGRVSVVTLKNFLTKAMFQTPVACLMHLDSQIVQLDTYSKFLLVSTQTRSLLCDTETERYRQIGKKQRVGAFGACFLNSFNQPETSSVANRTWGTFTTLGDNEQLPHFVNDKVKIYCARPGVRLWQADFQGNVVVTHQFRSSLPQKQSDLIKCDGDELKIRSFEDAPVWESFKFGKVFSFLDKFILTFKSEGFYIFKPSSSALQFWSTHLKNIKDIKIIDNFLYIWHTDLEVSVLSLLSIEEMILRSLMRRKYRLCGELCVEFFNEVESLLSTSKKIHLISALENKIENAELLEKLAPIFEKLKELANTPILERITNGIVTVNALPIIPESVQNFESVKDTTKESLSILFEQFRVSKVNKKIETSDFARLVKSLDTQSLYELIMKFRTETDENCDSWCKKIFLKNMNDTDFSSDALDYASDAFLEINNCENLVCKCGFPLPQAHQSPPKYYETGCKLMEKSHSNEHFLKKVPFMYRFTLKNIDPKDIVRKIALITQLSDKEVIETHSNKTTYDVWDESMRLLLKLKTGQCLHCGTKIDPTGSFGWTEFGILMVESIKPTNAIKLLKRYSHFLPRGELDQFFYQYCIFSAVNDVKSGMKEILGDDKVQKQFDAAVGGYLRKKILRGSDYCDPPSQKSTQLEECEHCQLPIKLPILENAERTTCGHLYHQACFLYNKRCCVVCDSVSYSSLSK